MNLMRLKNSVPLSDIKYAPRRGTLPSPGQNTLPALRVQDVVDPGKPLPPLLSGQDGREVVVQRPGAGVLLQEALVDDVVDLSLEVAPHVALPRAGWRKFLVRSKALRYLIVIILSLATLSRICCHVTGVRMLDATWASMVASILPSLSLSLMTLSMPTMAFCVWADIDFSCYVDHFESS